MARRWAVKIFLSHVHQVMYYDHFKEAPPRPFAIEHLGHAHMIFGALPIWALSEHQRKLRPDIGSNGGSDRISLNA
jgi:hypothetical protein